MTITYHPEVIQGSEAWLKMRTGLLTASEMKKVITPTLKVANNNDTRIHAFELAFQRITGFVEPQYISDAMLRGKEEEVYARAAYAEHFAPVTETGFVTNDRWGIIIGCSPDGLVGNDGLLECKSRGGRFQIQTIASDDVPDDYVIQLQTALLVTERKWIDFASYSGGLPLYVKRVEPDPEIHEAIVKAAIAFEERIADIEHNYFATLATMPKIIPTERRVDQEMYI